MRKARPVGPRDDALQVALDLHRIVLPRQPEALREPAHVRIDDDPLRAPELGGDDVGRLARDAGELDELLESGRNTPVELLDRACASFP